MAEAVFKYFYNDINKVVRNFNLDTFKVDGITVRYGNVKIPNFTRNKVKFKFTSNGINIKVNGLSGEATGRGYKKVLLWTEARNVVITIYKGNIDAQLKIKTKYVNGRLVPDAEIVRSKVDLDIKVRVKGFLGGLFNGKVKKGILGAIDDVFKEKTNELLKKGLEKIPIDVIIGNSYRMDYSLVNDFQMKNGFFVINSYALFYNQNIKDTQNKYRIPFTTLPDISSIGNQFELYVSEYSINSALFTFIRSNALNLNIVTPDITTQYLDNVLPGILKEYGNMPAEFGVNIFAGTNIKISEESINVNAPALILLRAKGNKKPFFTCKVQITASITMEVVYGPKIKGKVNDFNAKIEQVYLNQSSKKDTSAIEFLISASKFKIIPWDNDYIKKLEYSFPVIPGVSFTNLSIKQKDKYLLVNYNLSY